MVKRTLHRTSILKPGYGTRTYLMFAGWRHKTDTPPIPAKSDSRQLLLRTFLVLGAALAIGIVLWSQIRSLF